MKITSKVAAYSLVSYTPSLQEYGSAIIYNIGRMFPVQEVVTLSPLVALKEAKALCVPVAQYSEEGLPTVQLDYTAVTDTDAGLWWQGLSCVLLNLPTCYLHL